MKSIFTLSIILTLLLISCSSPTDTKDKNTPSETIKVATWNIQIFGQSKLSDTTTMSVIKQVCSEFDLIAIQEIRSKEQDVIPTLIDSLGNGWSYVISRRLGRTQSKEQYAFVYNENVFLIDTFQTTDPLDQIHREPFGATFEISNKEYTFLNVHTDPDEEEIESYYLDTLARLHNAILCGDFNRHPERYSNDYFFEEYNYSLEVNEFTNIAEFQSYDNFLFIKPMYYKGTIYNFRDSLTLSESVTKDVSDHYPVYIQIK